jgi:hypothetical protein
MVKKLQTILHDFVTNLFVQLVLWVAAALVALSFVFRLMTAADNLQNFVGGFLLVTILFFATVKLSSLIIRIKEKHFNP